MDKFNKGDKVKEIGGSRTGAEFIVEYKSEVPHYSFNGSEVQYHIKNDQKHFGFDMRENNLVEFVEEQSLFEQVLNDTYSGDNEYLNEMATVKWVS